MIPGIKCQLIKAGLDYKESVVYITLLSLGMSRVGEISKMSNLRRSTTYEVLKRLLKKGFIYSSNEQKTSYYSATDPERILDHMKSRTESFGRILPSLKACKKNSTRSFKVKHFEGKDGIRSILKDALSTGNEQMIFGNCTSFNTNFPYDELKYISERVKKKIKLRMISEKCERSIKLRKADKKELRESRFLDCFKDLKSEILLYDDKAAFMSYLEDDFHGVIVQNREVTDMLRCIFNEVWRDSARE